MTNIDLSRSAEINYTSKMGDTFVTPPVSFTIDGVDEDFTGATLIMQISRNNKAVKTLSIGAGIAVSGNVLQYTVSQSYLSKVAIYNYRVQKVVGVVVSTIQHGNISITNNE
jgi:hypothetical protein